MTLRPIFIPAVTRLSCIMSRATSALHATAWAVAMLFLALPRPGLAQEGPWKWIAYGDTRTFDADHRGVLHSIATNSPDYKFIFNVGDVVEVGSVAADWDIWQKACDDELGGTGQLSTPPKYMAAPGNHDETATTPGLVNWKNYLPGQARYGNDGKYFVFDYRDARFIVMNTEESYVSPQLNMLLDSLRTNTKKWLFVIWHAPIFDFGVKNYEPEIHSNWGVPLYNNGCDMIFVGHTHYYMRSKKLALNGLKNPPLDPVRGTAHIVTGNGGAPHEAIDENWDGNGYMVAYSYDQNTQPFYGYTELTVDSDTVLLRHISSAGQVMDQEVYTANPKPLVTPRYHLTVSAPGQGSVSQTPNDTSYYAGTRVVLTAQPLLGVRFVEWGGALSGSKNPETLLMDDNKFVNAVFDPLPPGMFELRASPQPGGNSITLDPPGGYYAQGTVVTATAVPAPGSIFESWGGVATGNAKSVTIVVDTNKILTARFHILQNYTMTARSLGLGSVLVTPESVDYPETTQVEVAASPAPGWEFVEWTGALNGSANPGLVPMIHAQEVKAHFRKTGSVVKEIRPLHDSFVRGSLYSSYNYGTDSLLRVAEGASDLSRYRTYIQFSLDSVTAPIVSAVLRLHAAVNAFPGGVPARVIASATTTDSWTQSTLNWKNAPPEGAVLDSTTGMGSTAMNYAWDLTDCVAGEVAGDKIITVLLSDDPGTGRMSVFNSKESTNPPVLEVEIEGPNGIAQKSGPALPDKYNLEQNYPNPFNPSTAIRYSLAARSYVRLAVYDLLGREISVLFQGYQDRGSYRRVWEGNDAAGRQLPTGLYICLLRTEKFSAGVKMVLLR